MQLTPEQALLLLRLKGLTGEQAAKIADFRGMLQLPGRRLSGAAVRPSVHY